MLAGASLMDEANRSTAVYISFSPFFFCCQLVAVIVVVSKYYFQSRALVIEGFSSMIMHELYHTYSFFILDDLPMSYLKYYRCFM